MDIGSRIRNLRIQKNLTQEELGERTDLSKGFISQLENNQSSPSLDTFFSILEVLGTSPAAFFAEGAKAPRVVYTPAEQTVYEDTDAHYVLQWLVPDSNEKQMEPVLLTFHAAGAYKTFPPSPAETFIYCLQGAITLHLGEAQYTAHSGEAMYFRADAPHQLTSAGPSQALIVATDSYL
ncbi:helix-turn-helix domain-containing protein [Schleiferilactobacillus perolens]|uniref:helix-turn-helix domain-containing protein n=1 Tax=Schleiferilactobacillus perolens TaxID=100468 RepID=UPI002357EE46|nr:XRE family transcriptional regulator [Schleiferilactobacillus perolens]MCI1891325.1 XRE family transcriptional regulator [Schleiferilactobacillus harbinensis]MCI1913935.1 XRE family transcriptional regulator [Schleiferilactobacillus harbinensis]MCI2170186.1 XRE family transcriptional regulator [Schleiferilactobacillus perolens]